MSQRRAREEWWGRAAIGALALLFLAAGFCCLDQDGMDDQQGMPMTFCSMAILILVINLSVALVRLGLAPTLDRTSFATILLAVPDPPPRRIRFS